LSSTGTDATATLTGVTGVSNRLRFDLSFDKAGAALYATAVARRIDGSNDYRVKVVVASTGRIRLQLVRRGNGAESVLSDVQLPSTISNVAGRTFTLMAETVGSAPTVLRAKLWVTGTAEPGWQATVQDATGALQGTGGIAITHYFSGAGGSLSPLTLSVDNLTFTSGA
jgi:hypothetical protein